MTRLIALFVFCLLSVPALAFAQHEGHGAASPDLIGSASVKFETSCVPPLQADFNKGVALLHSFWFDAADKAFGDIADLGLAGGVLDHRLALGQRRRHQHIVGGADGDLREDHARPPEAIARCLGDHVAAVDVDGGAERLEARQVQIDRARADGAAARQRHVRSAVARDQRNAPVAVSLDNQGNVTPTK